MSGGTKALRHEIVGAELREVLRVLKPDRVGLFDMPEGSSAKIQDFRAASKKAGS
jgi:hypothetical protein